MALLSHIGTQLKQSGSRSSYLSHGAVINLEFALRVLVNRLFTFGMIALLPLLIASAPLAEGGPARAVKVATASVNIIRMEPVGPVVNRNREYRPDRELRTRDAKILVEFH